MNGGLRGHSTSSPLKNVAQMEKANPYRNGIPKDLPNRTKDNRFISDVDENEAEESLSLYCKPVELYNIIKQRCEQQPLFLQRCLSYKINSAWQRRIRMTLSASGYCMGDSVGKDAGATNGALVRTVLVMVTRPLANPGETKGQVVYKSHQPKVLKAGAALPPAGYTSQAEVTFILPELRKMVMNEKRGDVVLFIISDTSETHNNEQAASLSDISGYVLWGSLAISSLCHNWLRNPKETASRRGADGNGLEVTSKVDFRRGVSKLEGGGKSKRIKISTTGMKTAERSLMQLQVRVSGTEMGPTVKTKLANEALPKSPLPYSLSHTWRPRVGRVVFHYLYYHGMLRKTEVTEDFSCPFCLNVCASFQGLRLHLDASHDLFKFEYMVSGELQVVNVTCRPDVVGPQGNIRDVDGLSDPRVKNFSYWYRGSRLRKRKLSIGSREHLQAGSLSNTSKFGELSHQTTLERDEQQIPDRHPTRPLSEERLIPVIPPEVADASEQHVTGDSLLLRSNDTSVNGSSLSAGNGAVDGPQEEVRHGVKSPSLQQQEQQKGQPGKLHDSENLSQVIKQRSLPAPKRQRMKGVLAERTHGRSRSSPTFGGACASAAGGQELDDCGTQQSLPTSIKSATDRPDSSRNPSLLQGRQYFHSHTAQPMDAEQLFGDRDSEDEVDSVIADLEDRRMLDDFVDVTPEEKEVMHLWNSFVRRNRVIADGHCPWGCEEFSKENAQRFGENPELRRCLMLFLVKLWNHHLVDGATISRCLSCVDSYDLRKKAPKK